MLGVLAFGDSITNGGGELQWGVALQSWALWLARALGLPYTGYAANGAQVEDVLESQIPAFERTAATPDAGYEVGCLYIGVNDVRTLDWDPVAFERDFRTALGYLRSRCERVVTATAPLDLGRPRAGCKVHQLNAAIRRGAFECDALVVDLSDFGARNLVMTDHVHPTAFGQIAIAQRALTVLERAGLRARAQPRDLVDYDITSWRRLRGDATYTYRHVKMSARSAFIRLRVAPTPP